MKRPLSFTYLAALALASVGLFLHSLPAEATIGPITLKTFTDPNLVPGLLNDGGPIGFCGCSPESVIGLTVWGT